MSILPSLGGLGFLLILSAFFSGSETALCALTRSQVERLRRDGRASSRSIVRFVDNPRRLFITILLGNTFVNISFATLTASLIYGLLGAGPSGPAVITATVVITLALLVVGEITPKTFAIRHATAFAGVTAPILWGFSILIYPLRRVLRIVTDVLLPMFGGIQGPTDDRVTSEDLKALVDAEQHGTLGAAEREIIGRILDLRDIEAHEIMVPRTEMVTMPSTATIGAVLERARKAGFSRIPIYRASIDDICGVLCVKDWLRWRDESVDDMSIDDFLLGRDTLVEGDEHPMFVHPPFFTLESRRVGDLFSELNQHRTEMAFLLDEFGGVSGSITVEDIVEEVVGEIADEHDAHPLRADLLPRAGDPRTFEVNGLLSVRQLNQRLELDLDEDLADTVGGYTVALFAHIPAVGDSIDDAGGVRFEVAALVRRRVAAVVITLPEGRP